MNKAIWIIESLLYYSSTRVHLFSITEQVSTVLLCIFYDIHVNVFFLIFCIGGMFCSGYDLICCVCIYFCSLS